MGDPINFESAASRHQTCDAFGDNKGATIQVKPIIQGETGTANICRVSGWDLDPVPFDGTYGARAFPAAAAFKDGSDSVCEPEYSVCEPEYYPLPPVRVADDEAAAAEAAKARGETLLCPPTENMPPGPEVWSDPPPVGWKEYEGIPSVFHCGFHGLVADCHPDGDHLQGEWFYDEARQLVRGKEDVKVGEYLHIDYLCAGTPNAYDAKEDPGRHVFGKGGIVREGLWGLVGTILHDDRARDEDVNDTNPPDIQ